MTDGRSDELADVCRRALEGDARARDALVIALRGPIQFAVGARLRRRAGALGGRDPRQEVEDLTHEVFVALFDEDAKALRAWQPDGGRSLRRFVEWFARHQAESILRSGRRSPWSHDPSDPADLEQTAAAGARPDGLERAVAGRQALERLLDGLRARLSAENFLLFELLTVEQRPIEEVMQITGLKRDTIYQRRHRLRAVIEALRQELEA